MYHRPFIPLEFCDIGQPFLIGRISMKFAGENVFCDVLRIFRPSGAAIAAVLNGGFYAFLPAYPQDSLVIYMNAVVVPKVIVYAAIALVRAFIVDFFHQFSNGFVFPNPVADLPGCPFVIG